MVDTGSAISSMGKGWTVALGVLLIIIGLAAILVPLGTAVVVDLLLGAVILVAGIVVFVFAFTHRQWKGFLMNFLGGILLIIIGALILVNPFAGVVGLSVFLIIYFIVGGFFNLVTGFQIRPDSQWGWYLFGGLVSIILGLVMWANWPIGAVWIMGLLVGINILIGGFAVLMLGIGKD